VFSKQIITFFRKEDLDVITIGARALQFQCIVFPLSAWIIITNMMLQTIGKGTEASILAVSRQGLFFMPAILILPRILGITGIQICQPVADVFSFLVAVPLGIFTLRELRSKQKEQKDRSKLKESIRGVTV
jgi:Na+-driven multidrug efflux pump